MFASLVGCNTAIQKLYQDPQEANFYLGETFANIQSDLRRTKDVVTCVYQALDAVEPGDFRVAQQFTRLYDARVFWAIAKALSCDYKSDAAKLLI